MCTCICTAHENKHADLAPNISDVVFFTIFGNLFVILKPFLTENEKNGDHLLLWAQCEIAFLFNALFSYVASFGHLGSKIVFHSSAKAS